MSDKEFSARPPDVVEAEALAREHAERQAKIAEDQRRAEAERKVVAEGGLLQRRGKKRRPRQYRGGEPERIPETADGLGGGGLIYQDVLPIPAPREPEPDLFDYDGWTGW